MKKQFSSGLLMCMALFFPKFIIAQNWEQMEKVAAALRGEQDQFGISVALSGDYAIIGAYLEDEDADESNPILDAGAAYIFKREDCDWVLVQKLVAADREMESSFGESVAMYGDYAVVCANQEDKDETGSNPMIDAGAVYIFKNINGTWTQTQKLVAGDRAASDNFGIRAAIFGSDLIVGAYREDEDANGNNFVNAAGAAYLFKNIGGTWYQTQKIVANVRSTVDNFGISVSIAGNLAVVGAYNDQDDANEQNPLLSCGSAYVFLNTGGVWSQAQKITHADRNSGDRFGWSVGIGEDHILVGANQEDHDEYGNNFLTSAGAVYSFQHNGTSWVQSQKILPLDRGAADFFGNTISISEDYVLISSYRDDEDADGANTVTDAGSAYIFKNTNGTWSQHQKICAADRGMGDFLGLRVAMSGDYILVGSNTDDQDENGLNTLSNSGSAYFFRNIDGESCEGTLDFCEAVDELITEIEASDIPSGIQNSLTSKLSNSTNSFNNGNYNAAINMLNAFINEVEAQSDESIPGSLADEWVERIQAMIDAIDAGETECAENNAFSVHPSDNINLTDGETFGLLTVFPNPGSTELTVIWTSSMDEETLISVRDVSGRIISSTKWQSWKGENQLQMDMSANTAGIYTIQLTSGSQDKACLWIKTE